jgi:hypothetical protein
VSETVPLVGEEIEDTLEREFGEEESSANSPHAALPVGDQPLVHQAASFLRSLFPDIAQDRCIDLSRLIL